MIGMSARTAHVKNITLYLRSPCLVVNKSIFFTRILLRYLLSLLAITVGIKLKIPNVCHYQC